VHSRTHAALGWEWDGMGCAGNSVYFNGGVHTEAALRCAACP